MQQWREVKSRHRDALVFFRVGDFYEMFYEDAEEGARLLDLTLTSRNNGSSRAPLAGVPVHALDGYLQRLVRLGRRVAICEQMEDPAEAKGIVRREVVETVTPGTAVSDALLDARRNNYVAAIAGDAVAGTEVGVAYADLSTGELNTRSITWERLDEFLGQVEPSEVVLPRPWELLAVGEWGGAVPTYRPEWIFDSEQGRQELIRRYDVLNLEGFGFASAGDELIIAACGALVGYLNETQPAVASCLLTPRVDRADDRMRLDEMTRRNLELVEPLAGHGRGETLLGVLDEALTPMGGRALRRLLLAPLIEPDRIRARLDAVQELVEDPEMRRAVRAALKPIRDLERLAVKVASGRCGPRDLRALETSLPCIPELRAGVAGARAALLDTHRDGLDPVDELRELLASALADELPVSVSDGGVIRAGYEPALDELREVRDGAVDFIARLQARERARTGINSLKVGYNKVFGYYLEITRANIDRVPADFQRKQTLANAERYFTPELKEWEEKVLGAEEKILKVEAEAFERVRRDAATLIPRVQAMTAHVAAVDVLATLAEVAVRRGYARPEVDDDFGLDIRAGRHPVVETMMPREEFIPNDVTLDRNRRVMILTGPNMAGKSTVLRQVGLITLLAQVGSFVPAQRARVGIVDRIFTRVGASDNLVRGQSTFMVEMTETAAILNSATDRSLVLLDEIGRGTSTWDGLSVATAVTEFLHERVGAKTIFATHYHELTRLEERLPGVFNFSVAVKEEGDHIIFLRSLVAGGADRSYGVEVARLAGLPREVTDRARRLLAGLEAGTPTAPPAARPSDQLALFAPPPHPVIERLKTIDPDRTTPMQALALLAELVRVARD